MGAHPRAPWKAPTKAPVHETRKAAPGWARALGNSCTELKCTLHDGETLGRFFLGFVAANSYAKFI